MTRYNASAAIIWLLCTGQFFATCAGSQSQQSPAAPATIDATENVRSPEVFYLRIESNGAAMLNGAAIQAQDLATRLPKAASVRLEASAQSPVNSITPYLNALSALPEIRFTVTVAPPPISPVTTVTVYPVSTISAEKLAATLRRLSPGLQLTINQKTNTLIVDGSIAEHKAFASLLRRIDDTHFREMEVPSPGLTHDLLTLEKAHAERALRQLEVTAGAGHPRRVELNNLIASIDSRMQQSHLEKPAAESNTTNQPDPLLGEWRLLQTTTTQGGNSDWWGLVGVIDLQYVGEKANLIFEPARASQYGNKATWRRLPGNRPPQIEFKTSGGEIQTAELQLDEDHLIIRTFKTLENGLSRTNTMRFERVERPLVIPDGMMVMTINPHYLPEKSRLRPGTRVNIQLALRGDDRALPVSLTLIESVQIFSAEPHQPSGRPSTANEISLLVTANQAKTLVYAKELGLFSLLLCGSNEQSSTSMLSAEDLQVIAGDISRETPAVNGAANANRLSENSNSTVRTLNSNVRAGLLRRKEEAEQAYRKAESQVEATTQFFHVADTAESTSPESLQESREELTAAVQSAFNAQSELQALRIQLAEIDLRDVRNRQSRRQALAESIISRRIEELISHPPEAGEHLMGDWELIFMSDDMQNVFINQLRLHISQDGWQLLHRLEKSQYRIQAIEAGAEISIELTDLGSNPGKPQVIGRGACHLRGNLLEMHWGPTRALPGRDAQSPTQLYIWRRVAHEGDAPGGSLLVTPVVVDQKYFPADLLAEKATASLMAFGAVKGPAEDQTHAHFVLSHNCRILNAIDLADGQRTVVFLSQNVAPNQNVTATEIARMKKGGYVFWLDHLDGFDSTAARMAIERDAVSGKTASKSSAEQVKTISDSVSHSTPQALLSHLQSCAERSDFDGYAASLTQNELRRFAGMMLQSASMIGIVSQLAGPDSDNDELVKIRNINNIIKASMRDNPPPDAVAAYGQLTQMTFLMGTHRQSIEPEKFSDLLRLSSGVLNDPRQFLSQILGAMQALTDEPPISQKWTLDQWSIQVDADRATAVYSPNEAPLEEGNPLCMTLQKVGNSWKISSLFPNEVLLQFAEGPQISGSSEGLPTTPLPKPGFQVSPPPSAP